MALVLDFVLVVAFVFVVDFVLDVVASRTPGATSHAPDLE